jgi:hypothetical protein
MPRAPEVQAMPREKPRVHFDFERAGMPKAVTEVSINDDIMVVLRGKVKSLSQYEDSASLSVEYSRLEIVSGAKPKTMTEVLDELRGKS